MRWSRGWTLTELLVGMAIMAVACAAFASLLKYVMRATTGVRAQGEAQEEARQALMKVEEALAHANEIRVASNTFVEFVVDLDQSPNYNPDGDMDGDGIPDYRDADRDSDASLLMPATAQWRAGFNLQDDDEDGDGKIDVMRRLWWDKPERKLYLDMSLDEEAWGGRRQLAAQNVSTFTLTYFGSKANALGRLIDLNGDGDVAFDEMDRAVPTTGMGNNNGALDLANERRYITYVRIYLGMDKNRDGKNEYVVETDVYPPLLPLKSR
ncbi:MAG: prepilin-type N-terminal cleavage/methylation domain-containing protein [Elusimicrobia bacterium]|nr:prepilin-type N-terminal cleavage/methylation domain-containing protein [Elusimicrobiota bacterium]